MNRDEFLQRLNDEGYAEIITVAREPSGNLDSHAHPFESKALILEGELRLIVDGSETLYQVGEIFHLRANQAHGESYGEHGVVYLVGRK